MTLVMDGVVRRGFVQITPVPERLPKPVREDRPVVRPLRYVTGIDGIRRPLPMQPASPQAVAMAMPAPMVMPANAEPVESPSQTRGLPWRRYGIGFALIASTLVFAGAAVWRYAPSSTASQTAAAPSKAAAAVEAAATVSPDAQKAQLAATALTQQNTSLQKLLNDFVGTGVANWEIVVKDLKTGATASINPDRSETSASLYKLYMAKQIYSSIDHGHISYGSPAGGGTGRNVQGCLTIMINISDNGCGWAFGDILGWGAQTPALVAEGYTGTNLKTPQQTDAHDVAMIFERLYRGTLNSPAANANFMNLLKDQRVNNRLPVGLPAGTVIAHKTGDLDGFMHDAGIVYGPKTDYIVTVMGSPGVVPSQFADLSTRLWNFFEN